MEKAKLALEPQGIVVHSTYREYKYVLSNKLLPNSPITTHDITNINYMFGHNLVGVRGTKVRNKPSRVCTKEYVNIPEDFYKLHKFMRLAADIIFVNGKCSYYHTSKESKVSDP